MIGRGRSGGQIGRISRMLSGACRMGETGWSDRAVMVCFQGLRLCPPLMVSGAVATLECSHVPGAAFEEGELGGCV
jgi:hypothetical protein